MDWELENSRRTKGLQLEPGSPATRRLPLVPREKEAQARAARAAELDAQALAAALDARVRGEVRFDNGGRALYATDGSNYRQVPIGVVIPRDVEDVIATVAVCREFGAPVLPRGGGTSLAGQCCNVAVVLDCSKYLRGVLELDPGRRIARVEPGCVLDELRARAEEHHLTFGPDPSTHKYCTLGGMLGNNSCGIHAYMAGRTADNTHELEVLTYDGLRLRVGPTSEEELRQIIAAGGRRGEIYAGLRSIRDRYADLIRRRYPRIPRRVSGYNLDELLPENGFHVARALVGTEGTCVTILEATLRLVPSPPVRVLVVLGYRDVYEAGDHVPDIRAFDFVVGLEGLDRHLIEGMKKKGLHPEDTELLPEGDGWLMVEIGAQTREEGDARAKQLMDALKKAPRPPSMKLFDKKEEEQKVWEIRESGLGATARVPGHPDAWPGWEDSAVPPERVGEYLRALRDLYNKYRYEAALYGHFGQGCIHCRVSFRLKTEDGVREFRSFMEEAADLVLRMGGSLSGEHGDGQARAELLDKMYGPELVQAFREFKAVWDPQGKMNPGKVVDPYRLDQNLRLGPDYHPPEVATYFRYPDDHGSFANATERCVGVGKCRRTDGGTMCPSYMVTKEEMHTTRGRARLLFEMLEGRPLEEGWRSEEVRSALDLCLACKGCKGDCPVNVDMATYKAEFFAHYYKGRLRPRAAYTMGLIYKWARLAALLPRVANFVAEAPLLRDLAKWLGGIHPARELPAFAPEPFTRWFARHQTPAHLVEAPPVLLWPDTFNNYFHPETARAAVRVLEAAGYRVVVPQRPLCCGRPLYDFGMLDRAQRQLAEILEALRPAIAQGVPVVGLEPSCVAVFRDELRGLFPEDLDAQRLTKQTFMLSEFLVKKADFQPPRLGRKAVVHGHCHHKSVLGFGAEKELFERLGLEADVLEAGCCGMAGSFGFEREDEKYRVSIECGERALLPAVRKAADEALIIADGFSCREQIAQQSQRRALHVAEVLAMALTKGEEAPARRFPERGIVREYRFSPGQLAVMALAGVGVAMGLRWLLGRRGGSWKL
ncbi:MAG TPA: FAD-linked oxidase C-terminal domain-containing protein [Polyangia bacterium]|nr:FAD-linked oxidase C-terminal domain-containing protein [Polyangia bacterium]